MSIIHEALKRTQSSLSKTPPPSGAAPAAPQAVHRPEPAPAAMPTTPQPAPPQPASSPRPRRPWAWSWSTVIVAIIILCLLQTVFLALSSRLRPPGTPAASTRVVQAQAEKPKTLLAKVLPSASKSGNLTLNGIITSGGERMALINDEIVKAGDTIDGKKVLSITDRKVEISNEGQMIVLTTKR